MKLIKPNTVLPDGGKLIKPFRKQVGGWVEMGFDAQVRVAGVRWLRVRGGMGERNDREDWVADAPLSASVHDYQWREPFWGLTRYATFEQACQSEFKRSLECLRIESAKLESKLACARETISRFTPKPTPSHPKPAMRPRRAIGGAKKPILDADMLITDEQSLFQSKAVADWCFEP